MQHIGNKLEIFSFLWRKPKGFCQYFPKGSVGGEEEDIIAEQEQYIINTSPKEKRLWKKKYLETVCNTCFTCGIYMEISYTPPFVITYKIKFCLSCLTNHTHPTGSLLNVNIYVWK